MRPRVRTAVRFGRFFILHLHLQLYWLRLCAGWIGGSWAGACGEHQELHLLLRVELLLLLLLQLTQRSHLRRLLLHHQRLLRRLLLRERPSTGLHLTQ